jgi:hypothetical protein
MHLPRSFVRLYRPVSLAAFALVGCTAALYAAAAMAIETPPLPASEHAAAVTPATREAEQWLKLLDAGRFEDSWNDAADVFRQGVTRDEWVAQLGAMRGLLGKTVMRELRTTDFSTSVRGGPTGEYVTVAYLTQFEKAPPALETIITARGTDGNWHIAGYNIGAPPPTPAR